MLFSQHMLESADPQTHVFPHSRVSCTHQQAQICGRLKGDSSFEEIHKRAESYFGLDESQCGQREYREWTPDCNRSKNSIEGIGDVDSGFPSLPKQVEIIGATSRCLVRHRHHIGGFRVLSVCSFRVLSVCSIFDLILIHVQHLSSDNGRDTNRIRSIRLCETKANM